MADDPLFDPSYFQEGPFRGKFVYHYTRRLTAIKYILGGDRQLLARPAGKMNDPLEHSERHNLLGGSQVDINDRELSDFGKAIDKAAREDVRILSTTLDRARVVQPHPQGELVTRPGKRGFNHPAMWAHYAENHTGVCLIFYRDELDASIRRAAAGLSVKSGEVSYRDLKVNTIAGVSASIERDATRQSKSSWAAQQIEKRWDKVFLRKHEEWSYEEEFRWCILGKRAGDFFIDLSGKELAGFLVGSECKPSDHVRFSDLADELGIPARVMMWQEGIANHPWPLSSKSDSTDIASFWERREVEISSRATD